MHFFDYKDALSAIDYTHLCLSGSIRTKSSSLAASGARIHHAWAKSGIKCLYRKLVQSILRSDREQVSINHLDRELPMSNVTSLKAIRIRQMKNGEPVFLYVTGIPEHI